MYSTSSNYLNSRRTLHLNKVNYSKDKNDTKVENSKSYFLIIACLSFSFIFYQYY